MASVHMIPEALLKMFPAAECVDCMKNPEDAPDNEIWTLWRGKMFIVLNALGVKGLTQMTSDLLVEKL
jgi:hypothetical protein